MHSQGIGIQRTKIDSQLAILVFLDIQLPESRLVMRVLLRVLPIGLVELEWFSGDFFRVGVEEGSLDVKLEGR